jgi:hypothetical protein
MPNLLFACAFLEQHHQFDQHLSLIHLQALMLYLYFVLFVF